MIGRRVAALAVVVCVTQTGCGSSDSQPSSATAPTVIAVDSPAFAAGGRIPARYTCDGANDSPPLRWRGAPPGAAALALVVDDPDAPNGTYTHWVVVDIDATATTVAADQVPPGGRQIANSGGHTAYTGPCPPSGTHHYRFTVYALSRRLGLPSHAGLHTALDAIAASASAQGRLVGRFGH